MMYRLRRPEKLGTSEAIDATELFEVLNRFRKGDFAARLPAAKTGMTGKVYDAINDIIEYSQGLANELSRTTQIVGKEGKLTHRATLPAASGSWAQCIESVNQLVSDLLQPTFDFSRVIGGVARGDLSQRMHSEIDGRPLKGEFLRTVATVNTMVDQLNSFASEVTRMAREVGTDGKLGGQALVKDAGGTWKDLTDNVNFMASNLTNQVRSISKVVNDVANGNLKRKLVLEAKGEIAELADTINGMIDKLSTFAEQVTTVAREVGVEGRLGGQANVPGAMGTWRDLTDNVNRLAANLTTQVRAIAEVSTAVTKWDLSRSITVEAAGEVAELKDSLNKMIRNLRETTEKSTAQDWLKTNIAKFTRLLQGQRDLLAVSSVILSELAPLVSVQHAVFYLNEATEDDGLELRLLASYAFQERKHTSDRFRLREGLVGQAAFEKKRILMTEVPSDYIQIISGLGESKPMNVVILPAVFEGDVKAVIELASFQRFTDIHLTFLDQLSEIVGIMLNTITTTMRTEELLKQSQNLATELQSRQKELTESNTRLREQARTLSASEERLREQQEELRRTNEELQEKAEQLAQQNSEVERKNVEIEQARKSLEEKAEQLAVSSKYKSEFLANMSHELRTPLNSMLILSRLFTENADSNLTPKQIEYAETIYGAGSDLLALINEILDLSKIEAGVMQIETGRVLVGDIREFVERSFRHVAEGKELEFEVVVDADVPAVIISDRQRLQQILKNLLSNAFKFTEEGEVRVHIQAARVGWSRSHETLNRAETILAFEVSDTGIGIPAHKQRIIFEAFQQAETGLTRKYPGTGLGLSISRELARLLGGEIRLVSELGKGSTFTLYLPQLDPFGQHGSRSVLRAVGPAVPSSSKVRLDYELIPERWGEYENGDDRADIHPDDQVILIIEDDVRFSRVMVDVARANGFKGIAATSGDEALKLAQRFQPDGITLDLELPVTHGWLVLDRLKHDPVTRHIPVYVVTAHDERDFSLNRGAIGYLKKTTDWNQLCEVFEHLKRFIETRERYLLVVDASEAERQFITELIGNGNVHTLAVATGGEAMDTLRSSRIDCMVVNVSLPDMTGFELIKRIQLEPGLEDLRIVVRSTRELTEEEDQEMRHITEALIVKEAKSPERLLEEVSLYLHRPASVVRERKARFGHKHKEEADPLLAGKRILIIDDDVRNLFALTSLFEGHEMEALYAERGEEGLEILDKNPDVHTVLVDIMMPGLDGFEVMKRIRSKPEFTDLPVIALTAKAMQDDREACIAAGATDYVAKPADTEDLLSIVKRHLFRKMRLIG